MRPLLFYFAAAFLSFPQLGWYFISTGMEIITNSSLSSSVVYVCVFAPASLSFLSAPPPQLLTLLALLHPASLLKVKFYEE